MKTFINTIWKILESVVLIYLSSISTVGIANAHATHIAAAYLLTGHHHTAIHNGIARAPILNNAYAKRRIIAYPQANHMGNQAQVKAVSRS
jgi:hypothetical protein